MSAAGLDEALGPLSVEALGAAPAVAVASLSKIGAKNSSYTSSAEESDESTVIAGTARCMKQVSSSLGSGASMPLSRANVLLLPGVSSDGPLSAKGELDVEAPGVSCDGPLSASDEVLRSVGVSSDGPLSADEEL